MNLSIINRFSIRRGAERQVFTPKEQPRETSRNLQLAIAKRRHLAGDGPKIAA